MKPKFDNKFHEVVYNLNQLFGKVEEVLAIITLWILIAVCVVFISARFIFHVPTPWADELARYFLILLVADCRYRAPLSPRLCGPVKYTWMTTICQVSKTCQHHVISMIPTSFYQV